MAICLADQIGYSKIIEFPEFGRPAFKDEQEVLVGFSKRVDDSNWDFNWVGSGRISSEENIDAPAIDFFHGYLKAIETENNEDAHAVMESYIDQTIEYYFDQDDANIMGTMIEPEEAKTLLDLPTAIMQ